MGRIYYVVAGLFGYMVFAWFAAQMLGLTGVDLYFVRTIMWAFGLSGAGIFIWWKSRKEKSAEAQQGGAAPDAGASDDISRLVRDAEARLAQSNVAKGAKIGSLPVVFVLGPGGSAKTNVVLRSGLEPELLAGHVYQENAVVPTRAANLWFARQTVLVEAGGPLVVNPPAWLQLVRRVDPGRMSKQAPRAAVVCFDLEEFTKPGAADTLAVAARTLNTRLGEVAQELGISFPVYVMFSKTDRVPFFLDYVRNLTNEEVTQVFGATLPLGVQSTGVFAEEATQRLNACFDELFYSLADRRIDVLAREHAPDKLPGAYEFPREFRKLRAAVVQFLVDLSKPSQLRSTPFLRGFYFSGVRPVVVADVQQQAAPVLAPQPAAQQGGSATGVFRAALAQQQQAMAGPRGGGSRRVPQWVFLSHFWNDIVLGDRDATAVSSSSVKASGLKRVLFATAAALCLVYAGLLTVSFFKNRALESRVLEAARGISAAPVAAGETPSLDALKRLDALRQEVAALTQWRREGAPLFMRWGLYVGNRLHPDVYRLYFGKFRTVMFGSLQAGMVDGLHRLPSAPQPTDAYAPPYNTLKAYLLTTSEHKRPLKAFLSPWLHGRWAEGRNLDAERLQLARRQFDFYADELPVANPYSTTHDSAAVEHARAYLKQFNAYERIYHALIGEASRRTQPVNYNRMFPNEAVSDPREVAGAFTKDGWAFMQDAFKKPDKDVGGEAWVLGPESLSASARTELEARLREMYYRDFKQQWRDFLKAASVNSYSGPADAAKKLSLTSANNSPLLALFCLVSIHTNVDAAEIKSAFQAPQQVVPPACQNQYVMPPNQQYMGSLLKLQNLVQQVAGSAQGTQDPVAAQTLGAANEALQITGQVAQQFAIDKEGNVPGMTKKLMEDPITQIERMMKGMGPAELRAKGAALCGQFNALMNKYPFNPKAAAQASIDELNLLFRPADGALWQLYNASLQNLMQKQGSIYVAKPGGTMHVTSNFLAFFNRAATFAEAAYAGGAQQPKINYALKSDFTGTNQGANVALHGQNAVFAAGKSETKQFTWPAGAPGGQLSVMVGSTPTANVPYEGPWAAFQFFGMAHELSQLSPNVYRLEWTFTLSGRQMMNPETGKPLTLRFDLDMMGAPPIFRQNYFTGWGCTANIAQ